MGRNETGVKTLLHVSDDDLFEKIGPTEQTYSATLSRFCPFHTELLWPQSILSNSGGKDQLASLTCSLPFLLLLWYPHPAAVLGGSLEMAFKELIDRQEPLIIRHVQLMVWTL